jgi:hypothetical protein
MGHAGRRLHEWLFATRFGAPILGRKGGNAGVDDAFVEQHEPGLGAEIMSAGKFGPPGWQDDAAWKGWRGPNPPLHTPTFVLSHQSRAFESRLICTSTQARPRWRHASNDPHPRDGGSPNRPPSWCVPGSA